VRQLRTGGIQRDHGAYGRAEAEATLRRLRRRQAEDAAAGAAMEPWTLELPELRLPIDWKPKASARSKPTAASVLERLRQRESSAAPTDLNPAPSNLINREPVS
jgi:hypothetical protein